MIFFISLLSYMDLFFVLYDGLLEVLFINFFNFLGKFCLV